MNCCSPSTYAIRSSGRKMASSMSHSFFPTSHLEAHTNYPSEIELDSEDTAFDTDTNSHDDQDLHDRHRTGFGAREVPYALDQFASSTQPSGFVERALQLTLETSALDNNMSTVRPALSNPPNSHTTSPSSGSGGSTPTPSLFSRRDSSSSKGSSVPPLTHTTMSLSGILPPHSMPDFLDIDDFVSPGELIPCPCFFKDILQTPCDEKRCCDEEWYNHILSHFEEFGPPGRALCIFCNRDFENEEDPVACWRECLYHIRYHHLRNDMVIEQMRPDFLTWAYFRDRGIITPLRYEEICDAATERPAARYPWLRAKDWESDEMKAKKVVEERRKDREENVCVIKERPCRSRRDGGRSARRPSTRGSVS